MRTPSTVIRGVFVCFIILGVALVSNIEPVGSLLGLYPFQVDASLSQDEIEISNPASSLIPPPPNILHFPLVYKLGEIELDGVWTKNAIGHIQYAFLPGDPIQYSVDINNFEGSQAAVKLTWTQNGPCGQALIMDEEFILQTGFVQKVKEDVAPDCLGIYTNTIELSFGSQAKIREFQSVTVTPSSSILAYGHGFDNCSLPTVDHMSTWWEDSPYSTVNIYLGGASSACPMNRGGSWLYQVAQQGWSFILTWVGPQAPCTGYNNRMSSDPAQSYLEGKAEADAAVATARKRGFHGDLVIYYDIEAYSKNVTASCQEAVSSFMQGWVERIHQLGHTAGAYGSACGSFMKDWAEPENPYPPDDVWIAHWYTNYYDPEATVWDEPVNISCMSDDLWSNHQRIKQYTGGHKETWGGKRLTIDSDVLDGHASAILGLPELPRSASASFGGSATEPLSPGGPALQEMQLLSPQTGWVLQEGRLLWTDDSGHSWREITPANATQQSNILGLSFLNSKQGWLVQRVASSDQEPILIISHTSDSGATWRGTILPMDSPVDVLQLQSAAIEILDESQLWIAFKLHSSSNFSLGRLFASTDGGLTWQESALPLGEPVKFSDSQHGWITGGPLNQTFYTEDGGKSWDIIETLPGDQSISQTAAVRPTLTSDEHILLGDSPKGTLALDMVNESIAWALVQDGKCVGYKPRAGETPPPGSQPLQCESYSQLVMTFDGGITWSEITPAE